MRGNQKISILQKKNSESTLESTARIVYGIPLPNTSAHKSFFLKINSFSNILYFILNAVGHFFMIRLHPPRQLKRTYYQH